MSRMCGWMHARTHCLDYVTVGSYWTDDVRRAFQRRCGTNGTLDRDTFLRLLQAQKEKPQHKHSAGAGSASSDEEDDDDAVARKPKQNHPHQHQQQHRHAQPDQANYQRKRPQLSLKLGKGAAAAGGAVKLGCVRAFRVRACLLGRVLSCLRAVWCLRISVQRPTLGATAQMLFRSARVVCLPSFLRPSLGSFLAALSTSPKRLTSAANALSWPSKLGPGRQLGVVPSNSGAYVRTYVRACCGGVDAVVCGACLWICLYFVVLVDQPGVVCANLAD